MGCLSGRVSQLEAQKGPRAVPISSAWTNVIPIGHCAMSSCDPAATGWCGSWMMTIDRIAVGMVWLHGCIRPCKVGCMVGP